MCMQKTLSLSQLVTVFIFKTAYPCIKLIYMQVTASNTYKRVYNVAVVVVVVVCQLKQSWWTMEPLFVCTIVTHISFKYLFSYFLQKNNLSNHRLASLTTMEAIILNRRSMLCVNIIILVTLTTNLNFHSINIIPQVWMGSSISKIMSDKIFLEQFSIYFLNINTNFVFIVAPYVIL